MLSAKEFRKSQTVQNAIIKYGNTPFSYVLDAAKKGDGEAIVFFVDKALTLLFNKIVQYKKDTPDEWEDIFQNYLTFLFMKTVENKGPISKFDVSRVEAEDDATLFKKMSVFLSQYLTALMGNQSKKRDALNHLAPDSGEKEEVEKSNVDTVASSNVNAEESLTKEIMPNHEVLSNKPFMDFLQQQDQKGKTKYRKYYRFMLFAKAGKSPFEVAKYFGWNTKGTRPKAGGKPGEREEYTRFPGQVYNTRKAIEVVYNKWLAEHGK